MDIKLNNLVAGIYFHPEAYPPTLNAIAELSACFYRITIVHRPHTKTVWEYPDNVTLVASGKLMSVTEQQAASHLEKVGFFISFLRTFYSHCKKEKPAYILVYDSISLYAYHLFRPLLSFPHKIWYHNHDVLERTLLGKYSIGYFAAKAELKAFRYLNMFSLPSDDRKKYFPLDSFTGRYFYIPNFPSKKFYGRFYRPHHPGKTVKLIFQGQVAPQRGIEQIIPLLTGPAQGCDIELGLIGPCDDVYKTEILSLCERYQVTDKVHFDRVPYIQLPALSATYHIGIALQFQQDIMTTTMGTASNKLFEYAALGLPVVCYNNDNYRQHLSKYIWAIPAELTSDDIQQKLSIIIGSYDRLSAAAHDDFMKSLNFETGFLRVKSYVTGSDPEEEKTL